MAKKIHVITQLLGDKSAYFSLILSSLLKKLQEKNEVDLTLVTIGNKAENIASGALLNLLKANDVKIIDLETNNLLNVFPRIGRFELLKVLPENEPFIYIDPSFMPFKKISDLNLNLTVINASPVKASVWPTLELYGPGYTDIWKSTYERFGLDFDGSINKEFPEEHWSRHPLYDDTIIAGNNPHELSKLALEYAESLFSDPHKEILVQPETQDISKVALTLAMYALGGKSTDAFDGEIVSLTPFNHFYVKNPKTIHALLKDSVSDNQTKGIMKQHEQLKRLIYQGKGEKIADFYSNRPIPQKNNAIQNQLKRNKLWVK